MAIRATRREPICFMRAQFWRIRVYVRAKVAEHDQVLHLAGVLEHDTGARSRFGAEEFVLGQFVEADELRTTKVRLFILPLPCTQ